MNASDVISDVQLTDLDHRDAQFVRAELIEKIDTAIAAAVQAETERCAGFARQCDHHEPSDYGRGVTDACIWIESEIRARNGTH